MRWLCRGVLPVALLASLVSASPVAADTAPAVPALTDRGRVLQSWQDGGISVRAAAESALVGGNDKIARFLGTDTTGQPSELAVAEAKDNRQAALQIATTGGKRLRTAAEAALAGNDLAVSSFLATGWKAPLEQDQRVLASQLAETGGPRTKAAANKALGGSIDEVRTFLSTGQHTTRESDERVRASQVVEAGGPATKQAGLLAMNGSIEDIREFLAVGQHIAKARDQEYADISQLVAQATEAGNQAEREKDAAVEASEQAVVSARLAREAADLAKAEAYAARTDATRAAAAAKRAAEAGRKAADAAKAAIASAQAAGNAARVAASAASQAAAAAAGAERAATRALTSAALGKIDEDAAKVAETAAKQLWVIADVADRAAKAAKAAAAAARAASQADANLDATSKAADEANGYANEAGAWSDEAAAAAASARRHAAEATRSANRAAALADEAGDEAYLARDAARSAATHAQNAAEAARDSSRHAGNAATAAQRANAHAASARTAAQAAVDAVNRAATIHQKALASEQDERETRKLTGINRARDLQVTFELSQRQADAIRDQALKLEQDSVLLQQQAAQPGADLATVVANGRKMAVTALNIRGSWSKAAASYALTGSDEAVIDYVRLGWSVSASQDERTEVDHLADESQYDTVRTAAVNVLAGTDAEVHTFYRTGRHDLVLSQYRTKVSQILETGGTHTRAAAQEALNVNTAEALTKFLSRGQYTARASDEKILVSALMETGGEGGGEEVKLAAAIAIEGPPPVISDFLKTGRYRAKQQDELTWAHQATITNLLAAGSQVASLALENAALAAKAAADANDASAAAQAASLEAQASAADAARYANDAKKSADQADASAAKARASASTARNAANQAWASANAAADSARSAAASAVAARQSADTAYAAVAAARKSAENANLSADAAQEISDAAQLDAIRAADLAKGDQEEAEFWAYIDGLTDEQNADLTWDDLLNAYKTYQKYFGISLDPADYTSYDRFAEMMHFKLDMLGLIPVLGEPADFINCLWTGAEYAFDKASGMDFGLSCFSMIPVAGWASAGAKLIKKYGKKALDGAEAAWDWASGFFKKKRNGDGLCPAQRNSFPVGTRVLMGDGSAKAIEQIRVGDTVFAADPTTGRNGPRAVTATIYTPDDRQFTELTVQGDAKLVSTGNHPFWVESTQAWTEADKVKPGDTLRTDKGATVQVASVRHWTSLAPAYNLTVDDLHTYHVLAGDTPVLVHNTGPDLPCVPDLDAVSRHVNQLSDRADEMSWRTARNADGELIWPRGRNEMGNDIWGATGAKAPDHPLNIANKRTKEHVLAMKEKGFTREMAQNWKDMYEATIAHSKAREAAGLAPKANPAAGPRAELMEFYLRYL